MRKTWRTISAAALLGCLPASGAGCFSLLLVDGPPPVQHPGAPGGRPPPLDCETGYFWPVFDTTLATTEAATFALLAAGPSEQRKGFFPKAVLGWAFVSLTSAIYGYRKVGECHDAHRVWDERPPQPARPPVTADE